MQTREAPRPSIQPEGLAPPAVSRPSFVNAEELLFTASTRRCHDMLEDVFQRELDDARIAGHAGAVTGGSAAAEISRTVTVQHRRAEVQGNEGVAEIGA